MEQTTLKLPVWNPYTPGYRNNPYDHLTDLAGQPRFFNNGRIDMGAYEYQASPTVISVTNPAVSTAIAGTLFNQAFTASGGASPYSYSVVSSNLPISLSLSTAGVLSGTPTQVGSYSVLVQAQDASGCVGTATTAYSLTVTDATPTLTGFSASPNIVCAGSPVAFTATVGNVTGSYTYTLTNGTETTTGTAGTTALSQTLTASGSGTQRFTLTVSSQGQTAMATILLTVNALPVPTLSAAPSSTLTCAQTSLTLTATGGDTYTFSGSVTGVSSGNTAVINTPGMYSVTATTSSGCSGITTLGVTSATAVVTLTNPTLTMTSLGVPFSQPFTASGGVSPYSFSLASGTLPTGLSLSPAGVLSGSATQQGQFPITVSATDANGCTGTGVVYGLSIPTTQFTVLSRDPENGNLNTNTLKPYLLLQNDGTTPIPYGELTVRYYLTLENPAPLLYQINYAQMGNDKVHFTYVPVSPARQGASSYIEFSFDASAGSLAAGNQAVIQDLINKQDYSMFFQGDDYSYVNNANFTANPHITAYRNGVLVYGQEPGPVGPPPANTPPTATPNSNQTATVGVGFSYQVNAFGDAETPNSLTYSASIAPTNGFTFNPATRVIQGQPTNTGVSSVTITATDPGGLAASTVFTITVNMAPVAPTALTLTASANPTMILTTGSTTLSATVAGGTNPYSYVFSGPGTITPSGNTATVSGLSTGVKTFTITLTDATSPVNQTIATTVSVTVTAPPNQPPVASTNSNQTATVGVQFTYTVGAFTDETPNSLTYTASIAPANGFTFNPATRVISGTPSMTGVSSVTITATDPGSLSTSTSFIITVNAAPVVTLTVLARDPENGNLNTNTIRPYLLLQNDGTTPIPYGELTVRYYLTLENPAPLRFDVNYAQMGNDKVHFTYVPLSPARQGATGYIEFSFDGSAGSLAPMSQAVIQDLINKQDYSNFFQGDDYSYVNNGNFAPNPHITAYRNGTLIYGQEPPVGTRLGVEGADEPLVVRVLGNPVQGSEVDVEVRGASGQSLRLRVSDLSGHLVSEQAVERAGAVERQRLPVSGQPAGLLFIQVSTPTQTKTIKVFKAE